MGREGGVPRGSAGPRGGPAPDPMGSGGPEGSGRGSGEGSGGPERGPEGEFHRLPIFLRARVATSIEEELQKEDPRDQNR